MSISLYIALYYNLLLLLVVYIAIQPVRAETVRQPYINNQIFSLALLLIVYVHVTFRPTDYHYFGDTSAYAMAFQKKAFYGTVAIRDRDIGFEYLTYWLSQLVNLKGYWFVLCSLYILPVFFALKKRFKQQYAVALVLFVCSLSFWGYGVNGLRNGIATSLVIFSFLVPNNDIKRIPVWIIACLFHQSVMLPIGCFLLTRLSNNPKHYLYLWGTFFLLMLVARDSFSTLLTNIPWFEQDKRMSEYLNMSYKGMEQMFSNIGFRWDFIIYSLIPIIAGVKYIYTYCYEDKLFIRLFNTKQVFTPVYNRKNLIGNLYQSLLSQTYKNFEWIIVDDGSTDDIDEIIKSYQNEDRILIRFIKQENGGKHRAINNGVLHAKGELFYIVDSDDYLTKDSIERIVFHYQYIKNNDKFAGVCGMKCFPDGSRIGKEVTWKILKDSWINYWIIKNIKGDVAFVFKTSVLRNYLFDDIPGEKFCAESLVLNRIGKNYLMLFFNEKIYIAEYLSDGLSVSSIKNRMNSPNYAMRIYSEMASLDIPYLKKIKAHINYWRFAPCSKLKMKNKIKQIGISSYIIFMPIGYLFHMKDKKNNYIDIRHVGSKR